MSRGPLSLLRGELSAWAMVAIGIAVVAACGEDAIASIHVNCIPAVDDLTCKLVALSSDVSRPARDVTAQATWKASPDSHASLAAPGVIHGVTSGDVDVYVQYGSRHAQVGVRFREQAPAQLLGMVHGQTFVQTDRGWQPIAGVRINVTTGANIGREATSDPNGTYQITRLVPEDITFRAAKPGYFSTDLMAHVWAGDGTVSFILQPIGTIPTPPVAVLSALGLSGPSERASRLN